MKRGFTLIELMLVMGIMAVLFGIMTMSFFGAQGRNLLAQGVGILAADMRSQQTKATTGSMPVGWTELAGYGIHFDTTSYTLFSIQQSSDSYDPGAATNSVVQLPGGVDVSGNTFPGGNVIFLRASGEVKGYAAGSDYVELRSLANNDVRRVRVNQLGVIDEGI